MAHPRRGWATCLGTATVLGIGFVLAFFGGEQDRNRSHHGVESLLFAPRARAQIDWGADQDGDGLSDEVEKLCGSDKTLADSDGDGFDDGAEWVLGSDPRDGNSVPDPRPAVRSCAYEVGDAIRVFCAVYPANLDLIETFHLVIGSPSFDYAPEGDPGVGVGIYDISPALVTMAGSYTETTYLGLNLVGFDFDIDRSLLLSAQRLNIGWASKLAGVPVVDQLMLGVEGATEYVLSGCPGVAGAAGSFAIEPLSLIPPPGDDDPSYCEVGLSDGSSVGGASVEYEVTTAGCQPDGLLYCINADCTALAGQKFVLIDYGFLQSKADE